MRLYSPIAGIEMVARSPTATAGGSSVGGLLSWAEADGVGDEVGSGLGDDGGELLSGEADVRAGAGCAGLEAAGAGGPLSIRRLMIKPPSRAMIAATAATDATP
ncbi:MAG TPA: hypothetical protein VKG85_08425 [Actinomycetes bacterium]|nr:hypothetical protein [Actinomycetes bacterium]